MGDNQTLCLIQKPDGTIECGPCPTPDSPLNAGETNLGVAPPNTPIGPYNPGEIRLPENQV